MGPRKTPEVLEGMSRKKYNAPAFSSRCSPAMIVQLWEKSLTVTQKEVVHAMGFGGLSELKMQQKNRVFILEVIKAFDHVQRCIRFKEELIPVTPESVGLVLGLPSSGEEVRQTISTEDMVVVKEFERRSIKDLQVIIREGTTDDRFKRAFILYVLCTFLCPTMKGSTTMKLLAHVVDVDDPRKYNWGKLVVDTLVDSVKEYKASKGEVRSIGGCVFFLMVWYLHSAFGPPSGHNDPPLVKHWTKEAAKARFDDERTNEKGLLNPNKRTVPAAVKELLDTHFEYEDLKELVSGVIETALRQQSERREAKVTSFTQKAATRTKKAAARVHLPTEPLPAQLGASADEGSPEATTTTTPSVQSADAAHEIGDNSREGTAAVKEHFYLEAPATEAQSDAEADVDQSPSKSQLMVTPFIEPLTADEEIDALIMSPLSVDLRPQAAAASSEPLYGSRMEVPDEVGKVIFAYCTANTSKRKRGKKSNKPRAKDETIVSVDGHFLHLEELQTLAPRQWISNIVVSFHAGYLNFYENKKPNPTRFYLSSWFADTVALDIDRHKQGDVPLMDPGVWSAYFQVELSGRILIFAPCVYKEHWWCYVLNREAKKVCILDSLRHGHENKEEGLQLKDEKDHLDELMVIRFKELMLMIDPTMDPSFELQLSVESLPIQPNKHDCGIYVMKYMEMWDGVTTYEGGLTMLVWDEDQLASIRRELLVGWVLDKANTYKDTVLSVLGPQLRKKGFVFPAGGADFSQGGEGKPSQRVRQPGRQLTTPYTTSYARARTRKKAGPGS